MPLTPIFHPQEDWYQAMVTKNKGSLKSTNRQEEWYEEIVDSMASGGLPDTTSASFGDVLTLNNNKEAVWTTPSSGGGVLAVSILHDDVQSNNYLDKTYSEIAGATLAVVKRTSDGETIVRIIPSYEEYDGEYYVYLSDNEMYKSDSVDGRLYRDGGDQ